MTNSINFKTVFSIVILFVLFLSISSLVIASYFDSTDACLDNCLDVFEDDVKNTCYSNNYDDMSAFCMSEYGSDYGEECVNNYREWEGLEFDSEEDCLEENGLTYAGRCTDDYENELKDACLDMFSDQMNDWCISVHLGDLVGSDGCCSNDEVWSDSRGICVEPEDAACEEEGGVYDRGQCFESQDALDCYEDNRKWSNSLDTCYETDYQKNCFEDDLFWSYDSDRCYDTEDERTCIDDGYHWLADRCIYSDDEYDCYTQGLIWSEDQQFCFETFDELECLDLGGFWIGDYCFYSFEQAECFEQDGYYSEDSGLCFDSAEERYCLDDDNGFWIDGMCFYSEDHVDCYDSGNIWSRDYELCFNSEEELDCYDNGYFWSESEGDCFDSEEIFNCYEESQFFCSALDSCVDDESMCCDEEDLYVDFQGVCADSSDEAECLNDDHYWSEFEGACFDSEDEHDCADDLNFWSESLDRCFDSEDELDCALQEGMIWRSNSCVEKSSSNSGSTGGLIYSSSNQANEEEQEKNNEGRSPGDITYALRRGTTFDLSFVDISKVKDITSRYSPSSYCYTPGKFSPDGESFIAGTYICRDSRLGSNEYSVLSSYTQDSTSYGNFNMLSKGLFFTNYASTLLDWNPSDNKFYFSYSELDSIGNILNNNLASYSADALLFDEPNSADALRLNIGDFDTSYTTDYILNMGDYFSVLLDSRKDQTSNLFQFNPVNSNEAIVGVNKFDMNGNSHPNFRVASLSSDSVSYSEPLELFDNVGSNLGVDYALPQINYYSYSSDGEYVLSYDSDWDRFQIQKSADLLSTQATNVFFKSFKNILVNEDGNILTSFAFDRKINSAGLPRGIFYTVTSTEHNKIILYYLDIGSETFFELYSRDMGEDFYLVDAIDMNPTKDELLLHICGDGFSLENMNEEENYNSCFLHDLVFNRSGSEFSLPELNMSLNYPFLNFSAVQEDGMSLEEQFFMVFDNNSLINIKATRSDGLIENYSIDLDVGIIQEGFSDNADAIIEISESELVSLLSINQFSLQEVFVSKILNGDVSYSILEDTSWTRVVVDMFSNFFSKLFGFNNKYEDSAEDLSCPTQEDLVCGTDSKTYKNSCFAERSNVKVANKGKCVNPPVKLSRSLVFNCNDDDVCTIDSMVDGVCQHIAKKDGTSCASNSICSSGTCVSKESNLVILKGRMV